MFIVHRSAHLIWIILIIISLLFSSSNLSWLFPPGGNGSSGPSSATEIVEDTGFTLALNGITISGGSDVAPAGTEVSAELITPEIPESIAEFADPVGTGVEITLENGAQPETPLTITFAPAEVAVWYTAAEGDDDLLPIVFASNDRELGVEFADAHLMPDGSVVVTTDHLSEFYPGVTRVSSFSNWMVDEVASLFAARSDDPGCFNSRNDSEWAVLGIIDQVFWPCVTELTSGAQLRLANNSPAVWRISSSVAKPEHPTTYSGTGILIAYFGTLAYNDPTTGILMPPDGTLRFSIFGHHDEIEFNAQLDNGLTTVNATVNAAVALMPASTATRIMDGVAKGECLISIAQESIDVQIDGSFVRMILDCMSPFIKGMPGTIFSSVTALPRTSIAMADATYRNLAGTNEFTFTLTRVKSDSSSWPTHRDDSVSGLYIWLGANFFGFPDWVACDNAREWCVVGYNGQRHLLVKARGLEAMYWIDDDVPSPRDALLSTGLPENVVDEILAD